MLLQKVTFIPIVKGVMHKTAFGKWRDVTKMGQSQNGQNSN